MRPRVHSTARGGLAALGAIALCAVLLLPTAAVAAPANFAGASTDGEVAFFTTTERLVPGDTDNRLDVYERSYDDELASYVTREVSTGPTGGNDAFAAFYAGISPDGARVFFTTDESLVSADTDRSEDIYARDLPTGLTSLVSAGAAACAPACGNGPGDAAFFDASADGSRVDFLTSEQLVAADTDGSTDVYERDLTSGTTTLVSRGAAGCAPACGNGAADAIFQGASADGSKVFFFSSEQLAGADSDSLGDIYVRDLTAGTTELVSSPGFCPPATDCTPAFGGSAPDGSRVFFETNERLTGGDTDSSSDLYEWSGGAVALLSTGPGGGNGGANATYEANAAGGTAVFFQTSESLVAADTDSAVDVYRRSGATTMLISVGPAGGNAEIAAILDRVSADGDTAIFSSAEPLVGEDTDAAVDVYTRAGATTTLASTAAGTGSDSFDAGFAGASNDASHVLFETAEPLLAQDGDTRPDIYERSAGFTELVSKGPVGHSGPFDPNLSDVSADGEHALFITDERLTEGDLDTERDVYDFSPAGTLLVSVGNSVQLGPPTPALTGTNPSSPNPSTTPGVTGQAEAGTAIKIYPTADCSGAPVGTGSSLELATGGIPVTVELGSTVTFHATATDGNGDTSACSSSAITYRQEDAAPPTEGGGGGGEEQPPVDGGGDGGSAPVAPAPAPRAGAPKPSGGGSGGGRSSPFGLAPQTKITFAPLFKTRKRRPVIGFVDRTEQEGTSFRCRVDRRRWLTCASPYKLKKLRPGRHVFRVKGVNAGVWERKPVLRRFKVVAR